VASLAVRNVPAGHADPAPVALPEGQKYPAASVAVVHTVHPLPRGSLIARYVPARQGWHMVPAPYVPAPQTICKHVLEGEWG
jgi:hypothetical protein